MLARRGAVAGLDLPAALDDATAARYREAGVDLAEASGERHGLLPVPSTWIIGADGVIEADALPQPSRRVEAHAVVASAKQYLLHAAFPERISTAGNLAFPFTPPELAAGDAYRFNGRIPHRLRVRGRGPGITVSCTDPPVF